MQHVIVDPGSTDGSRELIQQFHGRFSSVILEADRGPADGLNKGFAACDAEIYGYINSDDFYLPGALDWVVDFFDAHPDAEILTGVVRICDISGRFSKRGRFSSFSPEEFVDDRCFMVQQSTFFRRSTWLKCGGFNIDNRVCWDTELQLRMCLAGSKVVPVRKALAAFRVYSGSITGSGMHLESIRAEHERLKALAISQGVKKSSAHKAVFSRMAFRMSPSRRIAEMICR